MTNFLTHTLNSIEFCLLNKLLPFMGRKIFFGGVKFLWKIILIWNVHWFQIKTCKFWFQLDKINVVSFYINCMRFFIELTKLVLDMVWFIAAVKFQRVVLSLWNWIKSGKLQCHLWEHSNNWLKSVINIHYKYENETQ